MTDTFHTIPYTKELQKLFASKFDCGNEAINMFLRDSGPLDPLFGKTYVLISEDAIVGYYNISTGHIEDCKHPKRTHPTLAAIFEKTQKLSDKYVAELSLLCC